MKTKFRRIGKSSLSVLLTVMMLVSTIIVATVPTVNAATTYYYRGADNNWGATAMTPSADGFYAYIASSTKDHQFKISKSTTSWDYNCNYVTKNFNGTDISNIGGQDGDNAKCYYNNGSYYILIYYPNTSVNSSSNPIICASTTLPNTVITYKYNGGETYYFQPGSAWSSDSAKFQVVLSNGSGDVTINFDNSMKVSSDPTTYEFTLPNGGYWNKMNFKRRNANNDTTWNNADTDNIGHPSNDENCFTVTAVSGQNYNNEAEWTVYESPVTKYSISAASDNGANGTVTTYVNGTAGTEFAEGDELRFDITAKDGYLIESVTIGGSDVTVPANSIELSHTVASAAAQGYTYKVTYKADDRPTYTVTVDNSAVTNGSISASPTSAREGQTVTITGNPDTDYTLETVTVTYADDGTTDKIFDAKDGGSSGNTATFAMPAQDVTVTATFMESPYIRVDFSCDTTKGSLKVNGATPTVYSMEIKAGQSVTFVATANTGYQFSKWSFSNTNFAEYTTALETTASITITPKENILVEPEFAVYKGKAQSKMSLLYNEKKDTLLNPSNTDNKVDTTVYKTTYNGKDAYYATITSDKIGMPGGYTGKHNYYFALTNGTSDTSDTSDLTRPIYVYGAGNDQNKFEPKVTVLTNNTIDTSSKCEHQGGNYNGTNYNMYCVNLYMTDASMVDEITVMYVPDDKTYYLSATSKVPDNSIKVYAKDGTVGSTTADYGETTILGDGTKTDNGDYITYYAKENERITAQTVVSSDAAKKGYYVYAYVINGKKYDVVETAANTYQMARPYVMGTDSIEITPVYYNRNIDKNGDYITLYIDASTLGDHWGNTIAIYSYYYNTKNGTVRGDGDYPGQPMMLDASGYYFAKISKYAYIDGVKQSQKISGMTINNYYENESVHQKFLDKDSAGNSQKHNYQSYDYDDFVYIADMGCDTLRFDMKYKKFSPTNQSAVVSNGYNAKDNYIAPSGFSISNYFGTYSNGTVTGGTAKYPWEYLRDFDGNLASILGYTDKTIPSASELTQLERDNPLRIVSVGNQYTNMGEWSTVWYVYDHTNSLIAKGLPSDFIPRVSETELNEYGTPAVLPLANQTDAYKAIVNKGYQYKTAFITYESEQSAGTSHTKNSGIRLDGRWYYTRAKAQVTLETGIIYTAETDEAKWSASNFTGWTVDTYADATTTVGTTTNANVSVNGERLVKVNRNTVVDVAATHGKAYKFVGWATANDDGTYTISDTFTSMQNTYTVSLDKKIFAVYVPVSAGSLLISHSKFTGEGANNGVGSYFVSAVVTHSNDQTTTIDLSEDSCIIPSIKSDDKKVVITLKTVSNANSTFNYFYRPNGSGGFNKDKSKDDDDSTKVVEPGFIATEEDPATITYEIPVSSYIFNGTTQLLTTLNFYSDLSRPEIKDTIKFSHDLYADAPKDATGDPEANNGTGTPYIQVTIKEGNNVIYTSNDATTETVEIKASDIQDIIDKVYAGSAGIYTVEVTLTTPDSDQLTTVYRNDYTHTAVDGNLYNYIANDAENTWTVNIDETADNKVVYTYNFNSLFKYEDGKFSYNANNIKFYSDLTIAATCTITYKYVDRFGTEDDAPNKEYIVKLPLTKDCYVNKVYTLDCDAGRKLIKDNAPAINDLFKDCTWDITKAVINGVEATLVAVHNVKTYDVTLKTSPDEMWTTVTGIAYNSFLVKETKDDVSYCYTADKTYVDPMDGEKKTFSYWVVYEADTVVEGLDGEYDFTNATLVAKCQTLGFKLRIIDDYVIYPVYGDDKNQSVTISNAFYTREQFTNNDGTVKTDYLYADFIVAFMDKNNIKLAKDDSNESRYQTGLILAMDPDQMLADSDINGITATYDRFDYNIGRGTDEEELALLEADIRARANATPSISAGVTKSKVTSFANGQKMQHIMLDNATYNNFNRLDYYVRYNNTETNQKLVMKAYYYVYDKTNDTIVISEAVYYNLYDIANEKTNLG